MEKPLAHLALAFRKETSLKQVIGTDTIHNNKKKPDQN